MNTDATPPREILSRWPSRKELAADGDFSLSAAHNLHHRNRLWDASRDARMLRAAARRGIALTADELIAARAAPDGDGGGATEASS